MPKEIIKEKSIAMEYAVFQRGTFQYFAIAGQKLEIPYIDMPIGEKYTFSEILLIVSKDKTIIGEPLVKDGVIEVEIIAQEKTKKQYGLKYKAKSRYRRRYGYRQKVTTVRIISIKGDGISLQASVVAPIKKVSDTNVKTAVKIQKITSAKVNKKAVNVSK